MIHCITQLNVTKLLLHHFSDFRSRKICKIIDILIKTKDKMSVLKYSAHKTFTDGTYSQYQLSKAKNISKQISPVKVSLSSYQ